LSLDLPFEVIPWAILIYSNTIPSIRSSLFIKLFIHDVPKDIMKLFESMLITNNFREQKIRVSFREFDELLHYIHEKFDVLIFETRTLVMFDYTKLFSCSILECFTKE
jgi:hypothetical protein